MPNGLRQQLDRRNLELRTGAGGFIGTTGGVSEDGRCIDVAYFTSETAAREGEQKAPPPELADESAEFEAMMANTEFLDLRQPWLY